MQPWMTLLTSSGQIGVEVLGAGGLSAASNGCCKNLISFSKFSAASS